MADASDVELHVTQVWSVSKNGKRQKKLSEVERYSSPERGLAWGDWEAVQAHRDEEGTG